jgi:hypothetical protein
MSAKCTKADIDPAALPYRNFTSTRPNSNSIGLGPCPSGERSLFAIHRGQSWVISWARGSLVSNLLKSRHNFEQLAEAASACDGSSRQLKSLRELPAAPRSSSSIARKRQRVDSDKGFLDRTTWDLPLFRFAPESGHRPTRRKCPLGAKSGHSPTGTQRRGAARPNLRKHDCDDHEGLVTEREREHRQTGTDQACCVFANASWFGSLDETGGS